MLPTTSSITPPLMNTTTNNSVMPDDDKTSVAPVSIAPSAPPTDRLSVCFDPSLSDSTVLKKDEGATTALSRGPRGSASCTRTKGDKSTDLTTTTLESKGGTNVNIKDSTATAATTVPSLFASAARSAGQSAWSTFTKASSYAVPFLLGAGSVALAAYLTHSTDVGSNYKVSFPVLSALMSSQRDNMDRGGKESMPWMHTSVGSKGLCFGAEQDYGGYKATAEGCLYSLSEGVGAIKRLMSEGAGTEATQKAVNDAWKRKADKSGW